MANCEAKEVFQTITDLFKIFDHLVELHDCVKVVSGTKSYLVVSGVPEKTKDHASKILDLAIAFLMESKNVAVQTLGIPVMVRRTGDPKFLDQYFSAFLKCLRDELIFV